MNVDHKDSTFFLKVVTVNECTKYINTVFKSCVYVNNALLHSIGFFNVVVILYIYPGEESYKVVPSVVPQIINNLLTLSGR